MDEVPGHRVLRLVEVMGTLRRECPWDREQTHESLAKYLVQEAYETLETIEEGDYASLPEELGDVLLQVVFHSAVAAERPEGDRGRFTVDDVADAIVDKMTRRHPHVFGDVDAADPDAVKANWETIKAAERAAKAEASGGGPTSVLDGVPFAQPAVGPSLTQRGAVRQDRRRRSCRRRSVLGGRRRARRGPRCRDGPEVGGPPVRRAGTAGRGGRARRRPRTA